MKNNSHSESRDTRLKRFQDNAPQDIIETLLTSIHNYLNNEIEKTPGNAQTSLLFLGIHASILTISESLFEMEKFEAFRYFLEQFVDGEEDHLKFSTIAKLLYDWRNILAHQWLSSLGHKIEYDYEMEKGWKKEEEVVTINPKTYCDRYLAAFSTGSKLWNYEMLITDIELEKVKDRILHKFINK